MNVMLLSAGEGLRLRPYTLSQAKVLIPFLKVPLACYSLALLESLDIQKIVVNTFHLSEQVENFYQDLFSSHLMPCETLSFSKERDGLLGSAGAINKAQSLLRENSFSNLKAAPVPSSFLFMNADELILPHHPGLLRELLHFHKKKGGIATLLTMDHPGVGSQFGGVWLSESSKAKQNIETLDQNSHPNHKDNDDEIKCFSKTKVESCYGLHFIGVAVFSEKIFSYLKPQIESENILYETLTKAIASGEKVFSYKTKAEWFEVGNPVDFLKAAETCLDHLLYNKDNPEAPTEWWVYYLIRMIEKYGKGDLLLEKTQAPLLEKVTRYFKPHLKSIS